MNKFDPSNLDASSHIVEARDTIGMCITLVNSWRKKTLRDERLRQWLEGTSFKIANRATGSNETVE